MHKMLAWLSRAAITLFHPAWTLVTKLTNYVFKRQVSKSMKSSFRKQLHDQMFLFKSFSNSPPHAPITVNQTSRNCVQSVWPLNVVSYLSHPWSPCDKGGICICIDPCGLAYGVAWWTCYKMFDHMAHSVRIPFQLSWPEVTETNAVC